MTYEERAKVILEELDSYNKLDRVAWLATVLRDFERELCNERVTLDYGDYNQLGYPPLAAAAKIPDGED